MKRSRDPSEGRCRRFACQVLRVVPGLLSAFLAAVSCTPTKVAAPPAPPAAAGNSAAPVDYLQAALVGQWTGTAQAPNLTWRVRLELNPNGTYGMIGERAMPPDPRMECLAEEWPFASVFQPLNPPGVNVWKVQSLDADGTGRGRAGRFLGSQWIVDTVVSDLRLTADATGLTFAMSGKSWTAEAPIRFRLRRSTTNAAVPPRPASLAKVADADLVDFQPSWDACTLVPLADDPALRDWPEGMRVAVPIHDVPLDVFAPVGRIALAGEADRRRLRTFTRFGDCGAVFQEDTILVQGTAPGACTVVLSVLDSALVRVSRHELVFQVQPPHAGPPAIDRAALQALYAEGFVRSEGDGSCPSTIPSSDGYARMASNVVRVTLRAGSGIRTRSGRLEAVYPALDGRRETAELRSLLQVLSRARRYVALRTLHQPEAQLEADRVTSELKRGRALPDMNRHYRVFVDVPTVAQLAGIAQALTSNPSVACVSLEAAPSTDRCGQLPISGPRPPSCKSPGSARLPWPTRADIEASEPVAGPWYGPAAPRLPPGRPPIPPRPK